MKKKSLALLLVLVMVFSTSMVIFAGEGTYSGDVSAVDYINFYDLNIVDVFCGDTGLNIEIFENPALLEQFLYSRKIMYLQSYAIEAYNLLMREFVCTANGGMQFIFRDDYAGAFIDDNHKLIIKLTNLSQYTVELYNTLVEYSDVVSFMEVEFSLNELNEIGRSFVDMLDEANLKIASHGVNTLNNSYHISLCYADPESVSFKDNFSDMSRMLPIPISIDLGSSMELSLQGGSRIERNALVGFSVGATGTTFRGGHSALVTTGHFEGIQYGMRIFRGPTHIGYVSAFRRGVNQGGSPETTFGDWALVRLNDVGAGMVTNRIRTGELLLPSFGALSPVGTRVGGTGQHTLLLDGTIAHINRTFGAANATGITFVTSSSMPITGDSGGTVYIINSGSPSAGLIFEGVITGVNQVRDPNTLHIIREYWTYTPFAYFSHLFAPASPLNVPRISYPVRNWDQVHVNNINFTLQWAPTSGVLYFVTLDRLQHGTWQHSHNIFRDRHAVSNSLTIPRHYFDSGNNPYRITVIAWMGGEMLAYTRYFWLNVW